MNLGDAEGFVKRFNRITHLSLYSDLHTIDYDYQATRNDLKAKFGSLKLSSTTLESIEVKIKAMDEYPEYPYKVEI